jgi:hypothetical protein
VLLRELAHELYKPLSHIFKLSLTQGYFPSSWKLADVVAIYKKKSKSDPGNYRPISLLACISKLFETIVASPFCTYLAPLLNPKQFGFRTAHTSLDMTADMTQRWADTLKLGGEVRAVFLDVSKAFDKVWHEGIIYKLKQKGVSGPILSWFRSYLAGRRHRVMVGGSKSKYMDVCAGVPQGSVLGPVLFLVFFDSLFDLVENNLSVFADDSTLWAPIASKEDRAAVAASLNRDLVKIRAWAKAWLVTHNHTKTELLTVSRKTDLNLFRKNPLKKGVYLSSPNPNPHPPILFHDTAIPESPAVTVVGLTVSNNLSWGPHIARISRNGKMALSLLSRLRPFLSNKALSSIYKSHIRSRLEYLGPIWSGAAPSQLTALDSIQNRAVRIFGAVEGIKLQCLAHRRGVSSLCFLHRLLNKTAPQAVLDLAPPRAPKPSRVTRNSARAPAYLVSATVRRNDPAYWINSCINIATTAFNSLHPDCQKEKNLQRFKKHANASTLPPPFTVSATPK